MIGRSPLVWLALAALAVAVLFHTSYRVRALEGRLAVLNREIVREHEAIRVLEAEWGFLNDPERLERLARRHLALRPTEVAQIGSIAQIPLVGGDRDGPRADPDDAAARGPADTGAGGLAAPRPTGPVAAPAPPAAPVRQPRAYVDRTVAEAQGLELPPGLLPERLLDGDYLAMLIARMGGTP